jgi:hypothetical protein
MSEMTDRHEGYVVTLDKGIREDDAQAIINAIKMIKHVISVQPVTQDVQSIISYGRARHELTLKIFDAIKEQAPQH